MRDDACGQWRSGEYIRVITRESIGDELLSMSGRLSEIKDILKETQ